MSDGSSQPAAAPPQRAPQVVATSFLALFATVGLSLYGLPLYYDHFVRELGWSRFEVQLGNGLSKVIIGILFGYFAGSIINRTGPRRPMILGILFAAAALVGLGTVTTPVPFILFYCCNALGYVLAGPLPNQVLLARHFQGARGRAMGFAYLGIGVGFAFVPQLTNALQSAFGWRKALQCMAIVVVAVALPLILALRERPKAATTKTVAPVTVGPAVRTGRFYLLLIGSMASIGAVGGTMQNLKLLFSLDQHRSQPEAYKIITVIAIFSLIGRVSAGWFADRIGPKRVMLIVYTLVFAAMLLLIYASTGNGVYLFAVVFGLGLGGEYLIIPLMAAELFGTAVLGRVMGIVLASDGASEALFPLLAGRLRDTTGSYALSFKVLAALAAAGAVAIAFLPSKKKLAEAAAPAAASTGG